MKHSQDSHFALIIAFIWRRLSPLPSVNISIRSMK